MTPSIFSVYLGNLDDTDLSHTRIQVAAASAARAAGEPAPKGSWGEINPDHAFLLVEEEIAERGDDYLPGVVPTLPEGSDIKVVEPNAALSRAEIVKRSIEWVEERCGPFADQGFTVRFDAKDRGLSITMFGGREIFVRPADIQYREGEVRP